MNGEKKFQKPWKTMPKFGHGNGKMNKVWINDFVLKINIFILSTKREKGREYSKVRVIRLLTYEAYKLK